MKESDTNHKASETSVNTTAEARWSFGSGTRSALMGVATAGCILLGTWGFAAMVVSRVEDRIDRIETRIDRVEATMADGFRQSNDRMKRIESDIDQIESDINRIEGDIGRIETHIDRIETDIDRIEDRLIDDARGRD